MNTNARRLSRRPSLSDSGASRRETSPLWFEGEAPTRVDWQDGSVLSPREKEHHQHFNTRTTPARYLALRLGQAGLPALGWLAAGADRVRGRGPQDLRVLRGRMSQERRRGRPAASGVCRQVGLRRPAKTGRTRGRHCYVAGLTCNSGRLQYRRCKGAPGGRRARGREASHGVPKGRGAT